MLAHGFNKVRVTKLSGAQKVRGGPAALILLTCVLLLLVIDWARLWAATQNSWEHHLLPQGTDMSMDAATAARFVGATDKKGFPVDSAWEIAPPVRFSTDWQGLNADPERETEVRLLWTR